MMRKTLLSLVTLAWAAVAQAAEPPKSTTMTKKTGESCSEHIRKAAATTEKAAQLQAALGDTYQQHATWVGTATPAAKAEHDELMKLSKMYKDLAAQTEKLQTTMANVPNLANTEHNMAKVPPGMAAAHERVASLSSEMVPLLENMAKENKDMATRLKTGVGGAGEAGTSTPQDQMQDMKNETKDMKNQMQNQMPQQQNP